VTHGSAICPADFFRRRGVGLTCWLVQRLSSGRRSRNGLAADTHHFGVTVDESKQLKILGDLVRHFGLESAHYGLRRKSLLALK
jgi:hypothetical protein